MPYKSKYNLSEGEFANLKVPKYIYIHYKEKAGEYGSWAELARDDLNHAIGQLLNIRMPGDSPD